VRHNAHVRVLLLVGVLGCAACRGPSPLGTPRLLDERDEVVTELDLGILPIDKLELRPLQLENVGDGPLRFDRAEPDAGSELVMRINDRGRVDAPWSVELNEGVVLEPGARLPVKLGFRGSVEEVDRKQVNFLFSNSTQAQLPLRLRARRIACDFESDVVDFGAVRLGDEAVQTLDVVGRPTFMQEFQLVGLPSVPFRLEPGIDRLTLAPGARGRFTIAFRPETAGFFRANSTLIGGPCGPQAFVIRGNAVSQTLELDPASLEFGQVPVGSSRERVITFRNLSALPVVLDDGMLTSPFSSERSLMVPMAARGPGLEVLAGVAELTVRFTPTHPGTAATTLSLRTTVPGQPQVLVALTGAGLSP
jgi:hypothetical protein